MASVIPQDRSCSLLWLMLLREPDCSSWYSIKIYGKHGMLLLLLLLLKSYTRYKHRERQKDRPQTNIKT